MLGDGDAGGQKVQKSQKNGFFDDFGASLSIVRIGHIPGQKVDPDDGKSYRKTGSVMSLWSVVFDPFWCFSTFLGFHEKHVFDQF